MSLSTILQFEPYDALTCALNTTRHRRMMSPLGSLMKSHDARLIYVNRVSAKCQQATSTELAEKTPSLSISRRFGVFPHLGSPGGYKYLKKLVIHII